MNGEHIGGASLQHGKPVSDNKTKHIASKNAGSGSCKRWKLSHKLCTNGGYGPITCTYYFKQVSCSGGGGGSGESTSGNTDYDYNTDYNGNDYGNDGYGGGYNNGSNANGGGGSMSSGDPIIDENGDYEAEGDGEDSLLKIYNELTGKEKCLEEGLQELEDTNLTSLLSHFKGKSEFDINIKSFNHVYKDNGDGTFTEINGQTIYTTGSDFIEIRINSTFLATLPALSGVRTILHEYIHADIFRKRDTSNPTTGDLSFRESYMNYVNSNFEPTPEHQTMADLYIDLMKNVLKSYHRNFLTRDYNYLTDNGVNPIDDNFYEALAWQGLSNHGVNAYNELSNEKKDMLDAALEQYYHSTTKTCPEN